MQYIAFPKTELRPSSIALGTSAIGSIVDQPSSFRLLDTYLEYGGNFLDTAKVYADWLAGEKSISEKTIGQWMRRRKNRNKIILATKGGHPELSTMHIPRLSRQEIVCDLNESLKNLQTDVIDLYWLHRDDVSRPVEEIIDVLDHQARAGKIRYFGCSNWRLERIVEAQAYAAQCGLPGFVANQVMWSLAVVDPKAVSGQGMVVMDETMKQYHHETQLPAVAYSSQANGLFQKMMHMPIDQLQASLRGMYPRPANEQRFSRIKQVATDSALSVTEIVLGYLQSQPFPTVPIIGCRTLDQLRDSMRAGEVRLTADQVRYLEGGESSIAPEDR